MTIDMSALTPAETELRELADIARQAHAKAQKALTTIEQAQTTIEQGRAQWREATVTLAAALMKGRELHQDDDRAFGAWLKANDPLDKISANDREALLAMARYPEATDEALAKTKKTSWYTLWRLEISPKVEPPPTIFPSPREDPAPALENDLASWEAAIDGTPAERGSAPPRPEVAKVAKSGDSKRSASRSTVSPQSASHSVKSIDTKKFCVEALKVAGRLTACLKHPDDDLIAKVRRCLSEIGSLADRCQQ
jgi:hypothetical protein